MEHSEEEKLWNYMVQLRRIAAHREHGAEDSIRAEYQKILQKLQLLLAQYYTAYGDTENATMTQGDLRAAGKYASFLRDVADHLDGVDVPIRQEIRKTIEDTYTTCYNGMVNAVKQSASGKQSLNECLSGLSATTPEAVKHIVEHPMDKLTLSTVLERNRKQIVHNTKKTLAIGLANGDSYTRMAKRIAQTMEQNYHKARTIVRTEANRAINRSFQDVSDEAAELLEDSDYVEVKSWYSMADESVRDTHQHLNGKTIHAQDKFHSKDGAVADCPGGFGVAGEDINCRCFLKYAFVLKSEFLAQGGVIPEEIKHLKGDYSIRFDRVSGTKEITPQLAKEFSDEYDRFEQKFVELSSVNSVVIKPYTDDGVWGDYNDNSNSISIYGAGGKDGKSTISKVAAEMKKSGKWSTSSPYHAFRHELGHALQKHLKDTDADYDKKLQKISEIRNSFFESLTGLDENAIIEMKKKSLSIYGLENDKDIDEFIAECVAEYCGKNPRKISRDVTTALLNKGGNENAS